MIEQVHSVTSMPYISSGKRILFCLLFLPGFAQFIQIEQWNKSSGCLRQKGIHTTFREYDPWSPYGNPYWKKTSRICSLLPLIFNKKLGFPFLIAELVALKCCQDGQKLSEVCQTDVIHLLLTLPPAREDISVRCRGQGAWSWDSDKSGKKTTKT